MRYEFPATQKQMSTLFENLNSLKGQIMRGRYENSDTISTQHYSFINKDGAVRFSTKEPSNFQNKSELCTLKVETDSQETASKILSLIKSHLSEQ